MRRIERNAPPPRSVYRKLRSVLETARRHTVSSLDHLADTVSRAGDAEFTRYGKGKGGEIRLLSCSLASIQRVVALAHTLGFVDDVGILTNSGVRALSDNESFDTGLSQSVLRNLKAAGIQLDDLNLYIRDGLSRATTESLPTLDNLITFLNVVGAPAAAIRTYFQLLSAAGGIRTVRKKLFLPTKRKA